jgi:hypothetical protein
VAGRVTAREHPSARCGQNEHRRDAARPVDWVEGTRPVLSAARQSLRDMYRMPWRRTVPGFVRRYKCSVAHAFAASAHGSFWHIASEANTLKQGRLSGEQRKRKDGLPPPQTSQTAVARTRPPYPPHSNPHSARPTFAAPPHRPDSRFPPLQVFGRRPPVHVAPSSWGRHPKTSTEPELANFNRSTRQRAGGMTRGSSALSLWQS